MPLTLIVRSADPLLPAEAAPKLTFDGHRIVIGRGSGCDVRLPDPSITLRHASVRANLAEYTLVDEGSTNGTYVDGVRLSPHTPHTLKSGDLVRVGRVWLEVRLDQAPPTPDLAIATRDMALALVSQAMRKLGTDVTAKIHVIEGRDTGLTVALEDEGRVYVAGRGETCDVPLLDPDVSREHAHFIRRGTTVLIRDLGSKNGVVAGIARLPEGREVPWTRNVVLRIGKTALALEEPVGEALSELEQSADEPLAPEDIPPQPPPLDSLTHTASVTGAAIAPLPQQSVTTSAPIAAPLTRTTSSGAPPRGRGAAAGTGWTGTDVAVMLAAVVVLAMSVAGLVWLLRG